MFCSKQILVFVSEPINTHPVQHHTVSGQGHGAVMAASMGLSKSVVT